MNQKEFILNRETIKELIDKEKLVSNYIHLDTQLTPNGFDLTVGKISRISSSGALDFSNKARLLPKTIGLKAKKLKLGDKYGWWLLKPGAYKISTNEIVNLPLDLIALAFSRTSLLRMGAFTQHGAWDAGFQGKGEFILVVENTAGIKIKQNARIAQLIFLRIGKTKQGYNGIYKNI